MPEYLMLIYMPTNPLSPEEMAEMSPWDAYTESLQEAGLYVGGNALQGPELATTVRERDGQTQITDGPFAETKEVLGVTTCSTPRTSTPCSSTPRVCRTSPTARPRSVPCSTWRGVDPGGAGAGIGIGVSRKTVPQPGGLSWLPVAG